MAVEGCVPAFVPIPFPIIDNVHFSLAFDVNDTSTINGRMKRTLYGAPEAPSTIAELIYPDHDLPVGLLFQPLLVLG